MKLTLQVLQAFSDALYVSPAVYSAGTFLRFQPNLIFVQLIQKTRQFYKFTYIAFKSKKRSSFLEQSVRKKMVCWTFVQKDEKRLLLSLRASLENGSLRTGKNMFYIHPNFWQNFECIYFELINF